MNIRQFLQNKKSNIIKFTLLGAVSILLIMFEITHVVGGKVEAFIKDGLIKYVENRVEGKVVLSDMELTLTGSIAVNGLEIYDKDERLLLKSSAVKVSYKWFDFSSGQYNMNKIKKISIKDCEIFVREKDGNFNIETIFKDDEKSIQEEEKKIFWDGEVILDNCKVNLESSVPIKVIEEINAKIDFEDKTIDIDFSGKVEGVSLKTKGVFDKETDVLKVETKENIIIEEASLNKLNINYDSLKVHKLVLEKVAFLLKKNSEGEYLVDANGKFFDLYASGDVEIKNGKGAFVYSNNILEFSNLNFNVLDQGASGSGKVFLPKKEKEDVRIDFDISLPQANPNSLVKNIQIKGFLTVVTKIEGSIKNLQANGSFTLPEINVDGFLINNLSGNFSFDVKNKKVVLKQVNGNNGSGAIYAAGDIFIASEVYELDISGAGLDPTAIVDSKIKLKGNLNFNGHMSSRAGSSIIKGTFIVHNGSIYDSSFQSLSGSFVRQGGKTSFSNLVIKTKLGVLYPESLAADKLKLGAVGSSNIK